MRRFGEMNLSTANHFSFDFSLKIVHDCQIKSVFGKTDKLLLFLNSYSSKFSLCITMEVTINVNLHGNT